MSRRRSRVTHVPLQPAVVQAPVVPPDFRMTQQEYDATHVLQGMGYHPREEVLTSDTYALRDRYERAVKAHDHVGARRYGNMYDDSVRHDVYRAVLALRSGSRNQTARRRLNRASADTLTLAALDQQLRAAGLPAGASFHGGAPFVGFVPSPTGVEVGGRFFPSRCAVLVYACGDAGVERATVEHELAHWECYKDRCAGTAPSHRNGCEYGGQHDAKFYEVLERRHRAAGVRPEDARLVEGSYAFPRNAWWTS